MTTWIDELLARVPVPTEAEMAEGRKAARHFTLVFLRKGPAPRDDEARNARLQVEHLQYLSRLQTLGKLLLNGPIMTEHDLRGVSVYGVDVAEAMALASADPKVVAGYLTIEAIPWMTVSSATAGPFWPATQ